MGYNIYISCMFKKIKKFFNNKKGFTLTETLIVIAALGIIALITLPSVMQRFQEAMIRAKIKRAMSIYDNAVSKMAVENDLKNTDALKAWASAEYCDNAVKYFYKPTNKDACTFITADGIWWDISDITEPIVSVSRNELYYAKTNGTNGKKSFKFETSYDEDLGSLRINDLAFEKHRSLNTTKVYPETPERIQQKVDELEKLFGMMKGSIVNVHETNNNNNIVDNNNDNNNNNNNNNSNNNNGNNNNANNGNNNGNSNNNNNNSDNIVCRASVRNGGSAQICGNPDNGQVSTYTEYCRASDVGQGGCTKVGDIRYNEVYTYDETGLQVEVHTRDYRQKQGGNDYRTRNPDGTCTEHYEQIRLPSESIMWQWTNTSANCGVNVPNYNNKNL